MVFLAEFASASRLGLYLLVMLAAAGAVAALFRKFRLELIPGYLLAGVIVGPHAAGLIPNAPETTAAISEISELATVLLLFSIGLDLDIGHIRRGMVHILAVGVISTLAFSLLFWLLLIGAGIAAPAALIISMALAMSSTAVLVRLLVSASRESRSPVGRVTLGVAIVQDLLAVIVMALIPSIALWAGVPASPSNSSLPAWAQLAHQSERASGWAA